MRHFTRLLSLTLIITIVVSAVTVAYATETNETVEHPQEYNAQVITEPSCDENGHNYTVIEHSEPTQSQSGYTVYRCTVCGNEYTETKEHEDKYVAKIYICAKRQLSPLGHLWVYIHNTSDQPIEVGLYTVPANQGVSVGTFGLTRADGMGIYYNVEAYAANKYGLKSVVCMEDDLTKSELEDVSRTIRNGNIWDPIVLNCMTIAFSIWNAGAARKLIPLVLPILGRIQMLLHPHSDQLDMYFPTEDQVYKQRGIGSNATIVNVSERTLSHGL